MQSNTRYFKNIVVGVTTIAFYLASVPVHAGPPLAPLSLGQMYSLATQGNVKALRGAVQRGLNINITDRNGNTGLCHAIWKRDYTAYNAFQASGANPRHSCIQRIPTERYDSFMSSWKVSDVAATPRDAYKYFNEGEFFVNDSTYWIGGALLVGGIAAIALGGGGGGGSNHVYRDIYTPTDYSLGAFVGTLVPSNPTSSPYVPVKYDVQSGETKINNAYFGLSNDSTVNVKNPETGADETKPLSDLINFNDSVLANSKYIQVGMKASNGGFIQNGELPLVGSADGTLISLENATAGMVALHNSQAINKNTIRITSKNATIGMIASDKSTISNDGKIDMTFTGNSATNQVNGMYADTSSTAINNGSIKGGSVSENGGTLIGMQARIINQEASPNPAMPTTLVNATSGSIELQATANDGITTAKSLVGMGSYLEKAFLDGTKLIRRAGFVNMMNQGNIEIDLTLNGTGAYGIDSGTLLEGTGGLIGMRADANSTANNSGNITVNINSINAAAVINVHAGMQSVRGGSLANTGNITVTGGTGGYGMLGIRGGGSNPEIDSRKPTIINGTGGVITVDSLDGFGMATYHGGNLSNVGDIVLAAKGTGMHINDGTASNSGNISLANSGQGMVIKRNTGAADGATYNASAAKITNTATGNITIAKADGAQGMYIEAGLAQNDGTISVGNTENTSTQSSYGIQALDGVVINNGAINIDVLTTAIDSYGIHTTNATASNNAAGRIAFTNKGVGMHTGSGSNNNNGTITMNGGGTGMSSETGTINNQLNGQITLNDDGIGILSTTGQINNLGNVTINGKNSNPSVGLKSGSKIINAGTVNMTGSSLTGIEIGENGSVINAGDINISTTANSTDNYGIKGTGGANTRIDNIGTITITGRGYDPAFEQAYGISITDGEAYNHGDIIMNNIYGYGMNADGGVLRNFANIELNLGGIGMQGNTGKTFNERGATINVSGTPTNIHSYGIKIDGNGSAWNDGTINVAGNGQVGANNTAYGIYVSGGNGVNNSIVNMTSNNSIAMFDSAGGAINNKTGAVINLSGNDSYGMETTSGTALNEGIINIGVNNAGVITGGNNSYGMKAGAGATAINAGTININGANSYGMYSDGGTIINNAGGTIRLNNVTNSYLMYVKNGNGINNGTLIANADDFNMMTVEAGELTNNGIINIGDAGSTNVRMAGVLVKGGDFINSGVINVNATNSIGIKAEGGTATNNNIINVSGNNSIAMSATDGTIINGVDGILNANQTISSGNPMLMYVNGAGKAINNGKINLAKSNMNAIYVEKGSAENNGTININADSSVAMYSNSADGSITNSATGTIASSNYNVIALSAIGGNILNEGKINLSGNNSRAIKGSGNTSIVNRADISMIGSGAIIIEGVGNATINNSGNLTLGQVGTAISGNNGIVNSGNINLSLGGTGINATGGTATNTGIITMSGDTNYGMYAKGGATATNNGTIKISDIVGRYISYGMYAEGGSHLINNGTIEMSGNADEIIGMYATGAGSTISNTGTIILNGTDLAGSGTVCDGNGCGSYIKVEDGATLINSSRIVSSGAMDFASFSDDGTGNVVLGKGGSFEALEIAGDIEASSDIVMGSQKDEYVNENSFVGDDGGIEIASGSYMFDAALKTNEEGNMDVVMTRKAFSSIMDNQKIADYLESNYSIYHSIFDSLKMAGSSDSFASITAESLGLNLIPSFAKQNLDVIKSLDRQINQALFNNDEDKPMRVMVGYDFFNREQDGTDLLSGYKDESNSVYGLFDKKYDNNLRYGVGISVSKYESDYDNGSTRDEFITQALGLLSYENSDFTFISAPRFGVGIGDYSRATVSGDYEADTLNYYYGVTNEARKDFDMGAFTLEPVAELNVLGVYQSRTKEDGQLIVESSNNLSVETGLGLYAKKEFEITEKDIIKLRAGGTYYHELNNPYQAAKARIDGLNGSYHMDSYDTQRDRGVLSTRVDYKHEEFDFYAEANKYLEEDAGYSFNAGIGYRF